MNSNEAPRRSAWGSIDEAAVHLGVSTKTIRRMIARNEIEAKRFGPRLIRVNLDSIGKAGRDLAYRSDIA